MSKQSALEKFYRADRLKEIKAIAERPNLYYKRCIAAALRELPEWYEEESK